MNDKCNENECDRKAIAARLTEITEKLTPDQCGHFAYAIEQVASCYLTTASRGALLFANESDDSQSLVALNATEEQISELVSFMAEAFQSKQAKTDRSYLN